MTRNAMGRKTRDKDRKLRSEYIYGTTSGEVSEFYLTVDQRTGAISFGQGMTTVYSERSYERPKGPKVLSRTPQSMRHAVGCRTSGCGEHRARASLPALPVPGAV